MSSTAKDSPLFVFDFTLKAEGINDRLVITKWLENFCKSWCYQLEKGGETNYLHYQGRFSLKEKKRLTTLAKVMKDPFPGIHLSVTSSANSKNFNYVLKDDTRVEGPWRDDEVKHYIPRNVREIRNLYPFQAKIAELCELYDDRTANIIIAPNGGEGKSSICLMLHASGKAFIVPPVNDAESLLQMAYGMTAAEILATGGKEYGGKITSGGRRTGYNFIIDMPRAMNKDSLYRLYSGIESMKCGRLYDRRHYWKEVSIDPPGIFVFTNTKPDLSLLSMDRWKLWAINEAKELVPYIEEVCPQDKPINLPKGYMESLKAQYGFIDHTEQ